MGATPRPRWILVAAAAALFAASCGGQGSPGSAPASSTTVTFPSAGGVDLAGRLFGPVDAAQGVVLAHMLPADQTSWFAEAEQLGRQGYRVLTFDFRGYCPGGDGGCSEGHKDVNAAPADVAAALAYLRAHGPQRVALVGASMGGTASLIVAGQDATVPAVITLSAPQAIQGMAAGPDVLGSIDAAKLFIAGLGDPTGAAQAAQAMYDLSPLPKRLEIVTADDHGTDLLSGSQGTHVAQLIDQWLTLYLQGSAPGTAP